MDPDVVITGFPVKDLQDVPIRREDTGDIIINIGGEKRQVIVADKLTEDYFRPLPV
jgi:RNA-binding protein YlmH